MNDPLVIAGGSCAVNPEPLARFIDAFVLGDGEEALPEVCDRWLELRQAGCDRATALAEMTALPYLYVPRFYEPQFDAQGRAAGVRPLRDGDCPDFCVSKNGTVPFAGTRTGVRPIIEPAVVRDLDAVPMPAAPIVPWIECVHERIAIEIMRGCPWRCRFCQARAIKQPVRFRSVETILAAAERAYRATGFREIALLGLSSSDYPQIEELLTRLQAAFRPLGVSITMPSLRANARWRTITDLLDTDRGDGMTLAPEAAREELRQAIGKGISNDDLLAGCRRAMENGFRRIKLYFMCGLPGETPADLDGIIDLAEEVSRLGKQTLGGNAAVVANIANFIPKPHTPFERLAMQTGDYFEEAHERLRLRKRLRSVSLRFTDVESTLIEAALCRGDRRFGQAIEHAWQRGARLDSWSERIRPWLWHEAFTAAGIDVNQTLHLPYPADAALPWEHIGFGHDCGCSDAGSR